MNNSRLLAQKLIREKKLTREGLAFKSGLSFSTVQQWLAGREVSEDSQHALDKVLREIQQEPGSQRAAG